MKRPIKLLLCLALAAALSVCCVAPCFLLTSSAAQQPVTEECDPVSATEYLDESQVIRHLMLRQQLTRQEAADAYARIAEQGGTVAEYRTTYDAGCGYSLELVCLAAAVPQEDGEVRAQALDTWVQVIGSGSYSWTEFYLYTDIPETGTDHIRLMTRGNLMVETTHANPSQWEAAGFTPSDPQGDTVYYAKVFSVDQSVAIGG